MGPLGASLNLRMLLEDLKRSVTASVIHDLGQLFGTLGQLVDMTKQMGRDIKNKGIPLFSKLRQTASK